MMATALKRYTVDDYLALEEKAETKSEHFDGEIFAVVGGTFRHGMIAARVSQLLANVLEESNCTVLSSDVRIVCPTGLRTYPDVSVVCSAPEFTPGRTDEIHNPILLVEVLSPSTEAYDRGRKFKHYQSIPSLREYLLVSQERREVDHFVRQDDQHWLLSSYTSGSMSLASATVELSIDELYRKVDFSTAPDATGESSTSDGIEHP